MGVFCALLIQVGTAHVFFVLLFCLCEANNVNNFSAYQVPQHQFLQPQEALLRPDLVSTHLILQAKDPLLLT